MNKNLTKNQHYVPRFLLKHFTLDKNKERINIFDIIRSVIRTNQSINKVFSENYFYDRDNQVEKFISNYIETPASRVIEKIVQGDYNLTGEDRLILNRFILSLYSRTPEASERASEFTNSQLESIIRELLRLNALDPEQASQGRFEFRQDALASYLTIESVNNIKVLEGLEYHIIENETQLDFCISDHPAFVYNWFYRDLDHPSVTSLAARGLQIFIPLSSKITLALYDPEVYKYGQRSSLTIVRKDSDIEILNSFQVINSNSFIGFPLISSQSHITQIYNRYGKVELHTYESGKISGHEELQSRHYVITRQAKLRKMPSFIKVKKKAKIYSSCYSDRMIH